ncbi:hypothetical protein TWF569_001118 [Orbilia oligospora]|uniref:Kelch repeat-containing protein n=1 Tax=Orbilia oligospora TaxID=2813651 RepID=A0A7C8N3Q1_ORBOL|nr:hypothetical protein TWF706_003150 [Orbilia oligospora]KAF3080898.1 hypothetical protein TWF102_002043 [Orbilia oligospora]KAF3103879.1 hypothetical protein TWF103_007034 [Orbilia oligospora]KAF3124973.1 hypothetical protein TWF569_001118 [Orbilia oligospora]KAF3128425.1 hypothetical protein TWF594_011617 [Orbilia oligospora]
MNISALDPRTAFCSVWNHAALVYRNQLYIAQGDAAYRVGQAASSSDVVLQQGHNPWLRYISLDDSFPIADFGNQISIVPSRLSSIRDLPQRKNPLLWDITTPAFSDGGNRGIIISTLGLPVGNISEAGRGNSIYWSLAGNLTDEANFGDFNPPSGAFDIDAPFLDNTRFYASRNSYFDNELGFGYVVGGMVNNTPTASFLTYSPGSPAWRNNTLPWGTTAGDGAMGTFKVNNRTIHVYTGGEVNGVNSDLDIARIFDSQSNAWYDQPLTGFQGRIPSPRRGSCTAVVAAPDGSSYQMLVFGGISDDEGISPFSELWALNIPTFTWVLLDNSATSSNTPHIPGGRFGSSCHLIKGNKLMVFGGSKVREVRSITGPLNCDVNAGAGFVMDLNNATWLETYDGRQADYTVPERVRAVIGGGPTGGATMGQPVDGFADPTLSEILRVPISTGSPSSTPTGSGDPPAPTSGSGGGGISTGAIAGIAVAVVLVAIGGLFFLWRWRRNKKAQNVEGDDPNNLNGKSELPGLSNELGYDQQKKIYRDNAGNVITRQELGGDSVNPMELPAEDLDGQHVMELPAKDSVHPVELPAEVPFAELPDRQLPAPPVPPKAPGA